MLTSRNLVSSLGVALAVLSSLSACGGGGGGGSTSGGGGGGLPTPPPLSASGNLQIAGAPLVNGFVVFSCGCSTQAGTVTTDSSGNFTLPATSLATPSAPSPTYTLGPDRNYMVIGSKGTPPGTTTEAWTMEFLAQRSSNNRALNPSNVSDAFTAAGALYIFYFTKPNGSGDLAFDQWNFNQVATWVNNLKTTPTPAELKLIADINTFQGSNRSLFPVAPSWNRTQAGTNPTIAADLRTVQTQGQGADPALPTPCPASGCTGTPTP